MTTRVPAAPMLAPFAAGGGDHGGGQLAAG